MACEYKDILGVPRQGVHKYRIPILDIALVDTVLTFIGAWFIHKWLFPTTSYWIVLILFFILGELLHMLFCVRTPISPGSLA